MSTDIKQLQLFAQTRKKTLKINWKKIEKRLGFDLHKNIKDIYSRTTCDDVYGIRGRMYFSPKDFVKPSGNEKFDTYLCANGNTNDMDKYGNDTSYSINILKSDDFHNGYETIYNAFNHHKFTNCNIGKRAVIACIDHRCGNIWIFINNTTGKYEWATFKNYEISYADTPHGLVADDTNEFLEKLVKMWKVKE